MRSFVFLRFLVLTSSCSFYLLPYTSALYAEDHPLPAQSKVAPKNITPSVPIAGKSPENLPVRSLKIIIMEAKNETEPLSHENPIVANLKIQEGQPFSQAEFDQDLKMLAKEFDRVLPSIKVEGNEVDAAVQVWKKPRIRSIVFKGNEAFDEQKLMKEGDFQKDTLLDRQQFYKSIQKIRNLYVKKGYFEVEVKPNIIDLQPGAVDITVDIHEGRAGFIQEIRFHNFTDTEVNIIRDQMMTKEYSFWLSWLNNQGTYYSDVFRQDEMSILSYIQNEGYLDAKVTSKITTSEDRKDRIIIDVYLDKGGLYYLGDVSFEGTLNQFTENDLFKKSGLIQGRVYSPNAIRNATRTLYSAFGSKGYIDTMIVPETKLVVSKEGKKTYDVIFKIQQGKCYRVGMIRIIGNTKTDTKVILHETPLIPGSVFDSTMLAKTEERLRNVGYFKSVNVYAVRSDQQNIDAIPFRDVHIEVEENPTTAQFSAFGGFNTTEGISGGINFAETNFKVEGLTDIPEKGFRAVRGGGEYLGITATLGTKQRSYTLSWTKPYFLDTKWAFGIDLSKSDNEFAASDYTIKSKQMVLSLRKPLNAFVNVGTQYRLTDAHIDLRGIKNIRRNRELIRESKNGGVISAVGVSANYDSTNHPINPSTGVRSSLTLEYAGLFGDHHFATMSYVNTFFYPLAQNGVLKIKGNMQLIKTLFGTKATQLPMDERLYLGGEGSIRGFRYNAVGPTFRDVNYTPRGGLTSVLVSGEYEHKLFKSLHGFTFVDAGNVWWRTLEFGNLKYSAGFGIKFYISENAPLTLGLGFPVNPQRRHDVRRFFFSIGAAF